MAGLTDQLTHLGSVLRGRVPNPVRCGHCRTIRTTLTPREARALTAHGHLLCPCGGRETSLPRKETR